MNSLMVSMLIFGCVFAGVLVGMFLQARLAEHHLSAESKDAIKLGTGLIGTMTALVLGLLVASAKSAFDTQRNGVAQLAANVIMFDRTLARYGPEAKDTRELLRASVTDLLQRTWPEEYPAAQPAGEKGGTEGRYEALYDSVEALSPKTEKQRTFQAQALRIATDTGQVRWLLFSQRNSSIPLPFLIVLVAWLTLIFLTFGLFSPRNPTAMIAFLVSAFVLASALFLIFELDRPFEGVIQIPSAPLRNALAQLGK